LIDLTLQNYQFIALSFSVDRLDNDLYYVVDPMPKPKDVGLHCSVLFLARTVVKAPRSSHITPILRSLHWLKVNERIEYKLLSLTYKVLTTSQSSYLNSLISVQPPRSTRSASVVTLSRPP